MEEYTQNRYILNVSSGNAQTAIYNLLLSIPTNADNICARLIFEDARAKLLEAFRACEVLHSMSAPPLPPPNVCCGTHSE